MGKIRMSKASIKKPVDKKAEAKKLAIAGLIALLGFGFVANNNGWIELPFGSDKKPQRNKAPQNLAMPSTPLPPGAEFVPSDDPNKPSKIVTTVAPSPRVVSAKSLKDVVTDIVDASQDKEAAIKGIDYTAQLPGVNKEFDVQAKKTEIAKLRFEEAEWRQKLSKLEANDKDGFTGVKNESQSLDAMIEDYTSSVNEDVKVDESDDEFSGPLMTDFMLDGVTKGKGEYLAYLSVEDRKLKVKNGSVLYGRYKVKINATDDVLLCEKNECVAVF